MWNGPHKLVQLNILYPADGTVLGSCGTLQRWGSKGLEVFKFSVQSKFLSHVPSLLPVALSVSKWPCVPATMAHQCTFLDIMDCMSSRCDPPKLHLLLKSFFNYNDNSVLWKSSILAMAKSSRLPWNAERANSEGLCSFGLLFQIGKREREHYYGVSCYG